MEKILTADFSNGASQIRLRGIWQHDYGAKLKVKGIDYSTLVRIDFAGANDPKAYPVVAVQETDGTFTAKIPKEVTDQAYDINAYIYVSGNDAGYTVKQVVMPVQERVEADPAAGGGTATDPYAAVIEKMTEYKKSAENSAKAAAAEVEKVTGKSEQIEQNKADVASLKGDLAHVNNEISNSIQYENKYIRDNLTEEKDDAYVTSEEIALNIGESIYVYGFAYKNVVSVITECLNGTPYKSLILGVGTIISGKASKDWYKYTNHTTDKMFIKVCIQNTDDKRIYKSFNTDFLVNDITEYVRKYTGFVRNNMSFEETDGYFYTEPILLKSGNSIRFLNWSYANVVSMITKCSGNGHLIESKAISESIYGWYEYTNNSEYDEYVILSGADSEKYPVSIKLVMNGFTNATIFEEQTAFVERIKNLNTGKIYDGGLAGTPNNYAVYLENGIGRQLSIIPIDGNTQYTIVKSDVGSVLIVQTAKVYIEPTTVETKLDCGGFSTNSNTKELTFTSGADDKYLYVQYDRVNTGITLQVFKGNNNKESLNLKGFDIYSKLEVEGKFGESDLKILHMGDSLTALKNHPSLINDGNTHINISVPGAKIIPDVGDTFEGINFKSMVDSMVSGDYELQRKALNSAVDGSAIRDLNTFLVTDFSKVNKCVFWYGMNDYLNSIPLGESGSDDYTKVIPSLEYCLRELSENYPKLELYCVNVSYTNRETNGIGLKITDYGNAIKTVCEKFGVPVYDMYQCGGVNSINHTSRLSDGVHQNDFQNKIVARKIMTFMRDN